MTGKRHWLMALVLAAPGLAVAAAPWLEHTLSAEDALACRIGGAVLVLVALVIHGSASRAAEQSSYRKQLTLRLAAFCFGLLLLETSLTVISRYSVRVRRLLVPSEYAEKLVVDEAKAPTGKPAAGLDAWGYRNVAVPAHADILGLGDSNTFGYRIKREEAWPAQLGELAHQSAYNAGVSGWGFCRYRQAWRKAAELSPKWVVVGAYLGNDIADSYMEAFGPESAAHADLRPPLSAEVAAACKERDKMWDFRRSFKRFYSRETPPEQPERLPRPGLLEPHNLGCWFGSSAIAGLTRAACRGLLPTPQETPEDASFTPERWKEGLRRHYAMPVATPGIETVLTPEFRDMTFAPDDPRVQVGQQVARAVLRQIKQDAEQHGAKLAVLLIPTKERVYAPLALKEPAGSPFIGQHEMLRKLAEDEEMLVRGMLAFMEQEGIVAADATVALRQALEAGKRPYFPDHDGHLNAVGHRVAAETALKLIEKKPDGTQTAANNR